MKQTIFKAIIAGLIAALTILGAAFGLTSCNVTRRISTESAFYQRGDTTVQIVTKTTETYDAKKNVAY